MPVAIYKKLGLSKEDFKEKVKKLYFEKELSQAKIAEKIGCHVSCIENFFVKNGLKTRSLSESRRIQKRRLVNVSEGEQRFLDGLLLSDFHIESGKFQSRLSYGFKHKEFAEFCSKTLSCFDWSEPKQSPQTDCWHSKTKHYEYLHELRKIWYKGGEKIIPKDFVLTKEALLMAYLGDGMVAKQGYGAKLCFECFSRSDNQRIANQLNKFGIKSYVTPNNRVRISGKKGMQKMLEIIGECPVDCYKYKWRFS